LFLAVTDTDVVSYLERVRGSFGPTTLAMICAEKRNVKVLSLNGIQPGSVTSEHYPLEKQYFALVRDDASAKAGEFVDFILSSQGKIILAEVGMSTAGGHCHEQ
jgi:phosphate transport system substrate-binding protein